MAGMQAASMELKHAHPYSIQELHDLDTNHISEEILRLQKSIAMLESTNATLYDSLVSEEEALSAEDSELFQDTIRENEDAILAQKERIEMCIFVLKKRLGIDPTNKHYDLDPNTTAITARDVTPSTTSSGSNATTSMRLYTDTERGSPQASGPPQSSNIEAEDAEHGGMYL